MADSWQDSLQQFLNDNPDLPQGPDTDVTAAATAPRPRLDRVLDRKGRAGKSATIIAGFRSDDPEAAGVAAELKRRLATGGSVRGGEILIQGDKRQAVKAALDAMGYKSRII